MSETIRPPRPEEMDTYFEMAAQAFQVPPPDTQHWRANTPPEVVRGLFVDGEMRAGLIWLPMAVWFGPGTVPTGGISGVATPPEGRRQGYVGRLLAAVLAEMRDAGQPISALYPFYFPFYKRYGWAHASDNHVYTIPIERLPVVPPQGTWIAAGRATQPPAEGQPQVSDADLAVLQRLYERWAAGRSGAMARDPAWWRAHRLGRTPLDVYYWRDSAGTPRAYVIYTLKETGPWERDLRVRELIAIDVEARMVALGFLRNHDSQASQVRLTQPEDSRLLALLADPRVKIEVEPGFMLRLVDVPAALEARPYTPEAAGYLTLQVTGPEPGAEPTGYLLEVADGHGMVTPAAGDADLILDARVLAQLYTGYLTPTQAVGLGLLAAHDPAALARADAMFAIPRPFMPDFF